MEDLAKQNMPFMGLEIEGLKEYEMPSDLPHTSAMKARGIKVKGVQLELAKETRNSIKTRNSAFFCVFIKIIIIIIIV